MDIHDVKTQRFEEMLYKPIILAMEIHEIWWPNLAVVVHEIFVGNNGRSLMKRCVLMSWKSVEVHLVAVEVHGQFRLGRSHAERWSKLLAGLVQACMPILKVP